MPSLQIKDWLGLVTAASPYRVPPGGNVSQNNLQILVPGQMQQRPGKDTIYTALDYDEVIGVYRVANGAANPNTLILASKTSATNLTIRALVPGTTGSDADWAATPLLNTTSSFREPPTYAEDRHGRIHCFVGNGVAPIVFGRNATSAQTMGVPAPTVAPTVTPTGNGYFIERVDVLDGGGSYWRAPAIVISGGSPQTAARLKAVIQGGSVVAVDVIDGGVGYTSPPTLIVDETGVKGAGFLAYGIIGTDPGLQGFSATITTTATLVSGANTLASIASSTTDFRAGMNVRGTNIPSGQTIFQITSSSGATFTPGTASNSGTVSIVVSGAVITGTRDTSKSHGYDLTVGATSIAYLSGATTAGAAATWNSATSRWTALIPLTPGAGANPTSTAYAQVQFSALVGTPGNSYALTGGTTATAPTVTGSVSVASAIFSTSSNTWLSPTNSSPYTAANYFVNTDDNTNTPADAGTFAGTYQSRYWRNNNFDFFAAMVPNPKMVFVKRREMERRVFGSPTSTNYTYYADYYTPDYSRISYRYFTGAKSEIGTASDTSSKWVWATSPVGVLNGQPHIDITLEPALKSGTTPYATFTGNKKPIVRVYLKYCPDSWLNANADTAGDSFKAINNGWQRTGTGTPLSATDNLGWWDAGQADNGAASRPVVDFRQSSAGAANAGIAAGTIEVIDPGDGWEQDTFFAIQFDQTNAGRQYFLAQGLDAVTTSGSVYKVYPPNQPVLDLLYADMEVSPASPAYSSEYSVTLSSARFSKAFTDYRMRLYFQASATSLTAPGPPGDVVGEPSVLVPGSGFVDGNTASFTLRERNNTTDPVGTATWTSGQTYTFKAVRQTPTTPTSRITSVTIASVGAGYYGAPDLVVAGGGGFGLKVSAGVSASGGITSVAIQDPGTGFTTQPTITAAAQTAKLIPVLRPAMRGVYRCAYRYADYSQTAVVTRQITATSGSNIITVPSVAELKPGLVVDHPSLPWMTKIVSVGTGSSLLQLVLSANATSTATSNAQFRDMERTIFYSNFSPITDVDTLLYSTSPNPTQMLWSIAGAVAPARATHVEFFRTSADESLVFYRLEMYGLVGGGTISMQGIDTLSDEQLFDPDRPFYAAVPVVLPNGNLNAYRFGVPRTDMSVCVAYGDRLWYGVSTSGEAVNTVFFSEFDEFESCPAINELAIQNNQKTTDAITALIPFSAYLFVMQTNHCYSINYNTDPSVDASIQMVANRGCLSQHCHDLFDNTLYCMDERGIYSMDGNGNAQTLSDPIVDYFQKNLLDLSIRNRFFLKVDPRTSTLRAFVALEGQNAQSPTFALCYSLVTKTWWTESWPNGLTCACAFRFASNDADDCVYGAVDGDVYRFIGLRDQQYRSISSVTITSGGAGYISPPPVTVASGQNGAGAKFLAILKDGAVSEVLVLEQGYGYGAFSGVTFLPTVTLTIGAPPAGGTQATATATALAPSISEGVYPQATVPVSFKTGAMELTNDSNADTKGQLIDRSVTVIYRPTETATTLALREYFNNSPNPRINVMPRDRGTGFQHSTTGAATTLNMASSRSPLGLATGVAKAQFAGRNYTDNAGADRHIALELSTSFAAANAGDPSPSEVLLYGLDMNGVVAGGGK